MTISAQVRSAPGVWDGSGVKVLVKRHNSRFVLRIQLYRGVALELRIGHARKLADWIHDAIDAHEHEHPHEENNDD